MKTIALSLALTIAVAGGAAADDGRPPVPTTFVFEDILTLGPAQVVGETPIGRRLSVAIMGGSFSGPSLTGRILPGGSDYQLVRSDGSVLIDADFLMQTDDHVTIHVRNVGVVVPPGKDGAAAYAWTTQTLEAPNGRYGWLNNAILVSRIGRAGDKDHPGVRLTVYKVG